ncbi:hypothetical protein [Oceanobacillus rekensis]|uniref:hypothetical protein n=1 Tax=Oceanobacillus rekensis TaxID=937927 RepID=UPI001120D985|nr:hypothetical protein [Oceanobacillus rekensis]
MGRLKAEINTNQLINKHVRLLGSVGGGNDDLAGVYELMATGELDPVLSTITIEEIGNGFLNA